MLWFVCFWDCLAEWEDGLDWWLEKEGKMMPDGMRWNGMGRDEMVYARYDNLIRFGMGR